MLDILGCDPNKKYYYERGDNSFCFYVTPEGVPMQWDNMCVFLGTYIVSLINHPECIFGVSADGSIIWEDADEQGE